MFLSDICLSHTSGLTQEQRGLGKPKLAQRWPTSHLTQTPLSGSKGQSHQAALLSAALFVSEMLQSKNVLSNLLLLVLFCVFLQY